MAADLTRSNRLLLSASGLALVLLPMVCNRPTWKLLQTSALLSGSAAALATLAGTGLAWLILRSGAQGKRLATLLLITLLWLPLYVQFAGWDAALGKLGWATLFWRSADRPYFAGLFGAIAIHALAAIPWAALIVGAGLATTDPEPEEAASLEASAGIVFWRITFPQISPFLLAAFLWIAVQTAGEMTVTNIYLVPTYCEEVYNSLAGNKDLGDSLFNLGPVLLLVGLLVASLLVSLQTWLPRVTQRSLRRGRSTQKLNNSPLATLALWVAVGLLVGVPLFSLVLKTGMQVSQTTAGVSRSWSAGKSLEVFLLAPYKFRAEFYWTLSLAVITSLLALLGGIFLARLTVPERPFRKGAILAFAALLWALPGPLVGMLVSALFIHVNLPGMGWLYDQTLAAPVLAQLSRALPAATLLCLTGFAQISRQTLDSAAVEGANWLTLLVKILLPQAKAALLVALLLGLALSIGDLSCSLLVIPPGMDTMQRRLFGLVHSGVEEQVAGASLVLFGFSFLAACLVSRLTAPGTPTSPSAKVTAK